MNKEVCDRGRNNEMRNKDDHGNGYIRHVKTRI